MGEPVKTLLRSISVALLLAACTATGAGVTLVFVDVGKHDFPAAAYPAVRE
jgi:hypothetical protein